MEREYKLEGHKLFEEESVLGRSKRLHEEHIKSLGKLEAPKLHKISELE